MEVDETTVDPNVEENELQDTDPQQESEEIQDSEDPSEDNPEGDEEITDSPEEEGDTGQLDSQPSGTTVPKPDNSNTNLEQEVTALKKENAVLQKRVNDKEDYIRRLKAEGDSKDVQIQELTKMVNSSLEFFEVDVNDPSYQQAEIQSKHTNMYRDLQYRARDWKVKVGSIDATNRISGMAHQLGFSRDQAHYLNHVIQKESWMTKIGQMDELTLRLHMERVKREHDEKNVLRSQDSDFQQPVQSESEVEELKKKIAQLEGRLKVNAPEGNNQQQINEQRKVETKKKVKKTNRPAGSKKKSGIVKPGAKTKSDYGEVLFQFESFS